MTNNNDSLQAFLSKHPEIEIFETIYLEPYINYVWRIINI